MSKMMTADEFRKKLDSFHEALKRADDFVWRGPHPHLMCRPEWSLVLDQIWRDLNRECALMKEAERECLADGEVAVVPPESVRGSATEHNAEAIGKLHARVTQLEGQVDLLLNPWSHNAQRFGDARIRLAHLESLVADLEQRADGSVPHVVSGFPP